MTPLYHYGKAGHHRMQIIRTGIWIEIDIDIYIYLDAY